MNPYQQPGYPGYPPQQPGYVSFDEKAAYNFVGPLLRGSNPIIVLVVVW